MATRSRSGTGKVRKRVVTGARREQNRLNQRAYRQRQRRKDYLDGLLSAERLEVHQLSTDSRRADDMTNAREDDQILRSNSMTPCIESGQSIQQTADDARLGGLEISSQLPMPSLDYRWPEQSGFRPLPNDETLHELFSAWPFTDPSAVEKSIPYTSPERENERSGNHSDPGLGFNSISSNPTGSSLNYSDRINDNGQEKDIVECGGLDLGRIIAAGIETLLRGPSQALPSSSSSRLPDPWTECVHFTRGHIFLACIQNAQSMGFKVEDVLMPEKLAPSPFYQHLIAPTDDLKKILQDVTGPTTPAHLRPTLPQILYPHPAFLDLIPMSTFRARVITLLATHPHIIDMMDLKKDLAFKNGICYWTNSSNQYNDTAAAQAAHGQPWDVRSWEVAPWFLRKWRVLFGGEEGDIWKQSQWWQRARGELTR